TTKNDEVLFDSSQIHVLISDRDEKIAMAGESKKDYLNKNIGPELEKAIENRTLVTEDTPSMLEIVQGKEEEIYSYCISPVIANGDPIGCVMIFSKDDTKLGEVEEKTIETAASFLGKQME